MNIFSFFHVTGESRQQSRHASSDSVRDLTKIQSIKKLENNLWYVFSGYNFIHAQYRLPFDDSNSLSVLLECSV